MSLLGGLSFRVNRRGTQEKDVSTQLQIVKHATWTGKAANVCSRCKKINLQILNQRKTISKPGGIQLARLGQITSWNRPTCDLCHLFYSIRSLSTAESNSPVYYLYVYSTGHLEITLEPKIAAALLGVVPEDQLPQSGQWSPNFPGFRCFIASTVPSESLTETDTHELRDLIVSVNRSYRGVQAHPVSSTIDFNLLRSWINLCTERHHNHSRTESCIVLRLIDCITRRIVSAKEGDQYITLSYVWGKAEADDPKPTRQCLDRLPQNLPSAIEDAMEVVRSLGFQYIWVDRYCINQSDDLEKLSEVEKMDQVYRNAQITIIAAAGNNPSYGLPGVGKRVRQPQLSAQIGKRRLLCVPPYAGDLLLDSKWMTRAWTYQEAVLSRRRLIFTDQEVYFECGTMTCRESIKVDKDLFPGDSQGGRSGFLGESPFPKLFNTPADLREHVTVYSKRELTYDKDILNAIQGIFRAYECSFNSYLEWEGIPLLELPEASTDPLSSSIRKSKHWTMKLLYGFQWYHSVPSRRRKSFPSWSWTGWFGTVSWLDTGHTTMVPTSEINVSVEHESNGSMQPVNFEMIKSLRQTRTPSPCCLLVEAWVVQVEFKYLNHDPSDGGSGPGFYARTGEIHPMYSRLHLDAEDEPDNNLHQRLEEESRDCIVIGFDYTWETKESYPIVLVCEWNEDTAKRIGIVSLGHGISIAGKHASEKASFTKKWRKFRLV